jgi:hypothetical protein
MNLITVTEGSKFGVGGSVTGGAKGTVPFGELSFSVTVNGSYENSSSTTSSAAVSSYGSAFPATMSQIAQKLPAVGKEITSVTAYFVEYDVLRASPGGTYRYTTVSFGYQLCWQAACSLFPGGGIHQRDRFGSRSERYFPATNRDLPTHNSLSAGQVKNIQNGFSAVATVAGNNPPIKTQQRCIYESSKLNNDHWSPITIISQSSC